MIIECINKGSINMAYVQCSKKLITDTQSALDLIMTIQYNYETKYIIIDKQCITNDFFILSTGLAGEILQKFVNYDIKWPLLEIFLLIRVSL